MAGFLTNLGLAAGRDLMYGQEYEEKQADIQYKKQQVAMGQIALQNAQKEQQTAQTVGAFLSSEAAKDQSNITDPVKSAQMYEKGAGMFLQNGDLAGAEEMSKLAQGKLTEAKEAAVAQAQQKHVKDEAFATAADDYAANPTADGYKTMAKAALEAGKDPSKIPLPGTPQMAAYLNNAATAGMDSKSKAEFAQKAYEQDENRKARIQAHQDHEKDVQTQRQATALMRESMEQNQHERLQIERERLTFEEKKQAEGGAKGQQMSQRARDQAGAVVGNAAEAVRNIDVMSDMKIGTSNTPFSEIHGGGYLDAIAKTGAAAFTPVNTQLLASAQGGLVAELTNINVVGPGTRGPTQARIAEMHRALDFQAGSPPIVNLFKFANAADIARVRLKNTPDSLLTPEGVASKKEQLDILSKIPTPKQVYKAAQNSPYAEQINQSQASIADVSQDMVNMAKHKEESGTGLPEAPDTGAGTTAPPLPSGWSVKEH